ncbi:hypothetical protein P0W64_21155 [Tsukamurella sp. 8F]|nr:hypothetical protein [Tsukamurella sp. 8F]MDF0589292.1 hypothetical protein [Tsukamurella sp. 8F]
MSQAQWGAGTATTVGACAVECGVLTASAVAMVVGGVLAAAGVVSGRWSHRSGPSARAWRSYRRACRVQAVRGRIGAVVRLLGYGVLASTMAPSAWLRRATSHDAHVTVPFGVVRRRGGVIERVDQRGHLIRTLPDGRVVADVESQS